MSNGVLKPTVENLDTREPNTWCPGCGNFGLLRALKTAISELGYPKEKFMIVTGIGCHGKIFNYIDINGFHGIHGRTLPFGTGIKLANHDLTVLCHAGDGDQFDEGLGHLPHAARKNVDVKLFIHDNKVYGLTTGQRSPTTIKGYVSKTSPHGEFAPRIEPLKIALASNASFVARGWVGDLTHLKELMKAAFQHRGFALLNILQVCFVWNKVQTFQFYRDKVYKLEDEDHDTNDFMAAWNKAVEWGDRIPIGIFYQEDRPVYRDQYPQLEKGIMVKQPTAPTGLEKFIEEFM